MRPTITFSGRLAKIAEMHSQEMAAGGMTSGDCNECGWSWPCPTYRWATEPGVDSLCTWDLSECEFDHPHPQGNADGDADG